MTIQIKFFRPCNIDTIRKVVTKYYDIEQISYEDYGEYFSLNFLIKDLHTCLIKKLARLEKNINDLYGNDADVLIIETSSIL